MKKMTEQEALEEYYKALQKEYEKECICYIDSWGNTQFISEEDKFKLDIANYLIDRPSMSIRQLSREFGIPKSTLWDWLHKDISYIDDDIYVQCKNIIRRHRR